MTEASTVLARFASQIRWVTESVLASFGLPDHMIEDLRQDAAILVLSYAGIIKGRQFNKLSYIEAKSEGDEHRIHHMMAVTLRTDLSQQVMRALGKILPQANETVDELLGSDREPSEPSHETESDNHMDEARYLRQYPTFARNVLDGVSQPQLATELGVSLPTVERRIRGEKRSFLSTQLRRRGILVEGDETMDELEEAYSYARVSR